MDFLLRKQIRGIVIDAGHGDNFMYYAIKITWDLYNTEVLVISEVWKKWY